MLQFADLSKVYATGRPQRRRRFHIGKRGQIPNALYWQPEISRLFETTVNRVTHNPSSRLAIYNGDVAFVLAILEVVWLRQVASNSVGGQLVGFAFCFRNWKRCDFWLFAFCLFLYSTTLHRQKAK